MMSIYHPPVWLTVISFHATVMDAKHQTSNKAKKRVNKLHFQCLEKCARSKKRAQKQTSLTNKQLEGQEHRK